jgi:biotin carboxylase
MNTTVAIDDQTSRHVALVDTYGPSASRLAPAFHNARYVPIRVQSTAEVPQQYRGLADSFPYRFAIQHRGDLAETVKALSVFHPIAVVAGCEVGVELADALSEALNPLTGAPTNGTALSSARRDKYVMIERIKQQGLRGAEQILVENEDQLRLWHTKLGGMVILKPLRSSGGDGVRWCRNPGDSVRTFRWLTTRDTSDAQPHDAVVAQEYLIGGEYIVNTVSRDGLHNVCDIWKTHCISANEIADLPVAYQILPATGEIQDKLVPYAFEVLDALGIRHGAGHAEIKMTPDGPCLVEVGARIAGQDLPGYALNATGQSQVEWTVDAYTAPVRFKQRRGRPYQLHRSVAHAFMIAPRSGRLVAYHGLNAIEQLESYQSMHVLVRPGQRLARTVDDRTRPVVVSLMHDVDDVLLRDLWTLRFIDGDGFYELDATDTDRA